MHPILIQKGSFQITSWGTMVIIAAIVALIVIFIRAKAYKIPIQQLKAALHYSVPVVIAGFIGARLFFILEHIRFFISYPREIFALRQAGLSWYGGLVLGLLLGFWLIRKVKFNLGLVLDILAPVISIGFFIGRIGCFLAGCCFGRPTQMPWGVVFPSTSPASMVYGGLVNVHPTQLYSSFAGLISFFILLFLERRIKIRPQGLIFFSFLILYGLWRFIIEFFRWHDPGLYIYGWITWGHLYSFTTFLFGVGLLLWSLRHFQKAWKI